MDAGPNRILAADDSDSQIWDVSAPSATAVLIGIADFANPPLGVTFGPSGELLVATDGSAIEVFTPQGSYVGQLVPPATPDNSAMYFVNGVLPYQLPGGGAALVAYGSGMTAFAYAGAAALDAGTFYPSALWVVPTLSVTQCALGPAGTLIAATGFQMSWMELATGQPPSTGGMSFGAFTNAEFQGVAASFDGGFLAVGSDGEQTNGVLALLGADGSCLAERSGGSCDGDCGSACSGNDPALMGIAFNQALGLPDGTFLVTAGDSPGAGGPVIYAVDPGAALATTVYFQGKPFAQGGPLFIGLGASLAPIP